MKRILFLISMFITTPWLTHAAQKPHDQKPKIVIPPNVKRLIHIYVLSNNLDGVKALVEQKPDSLRLTDEKGNTPLHLAIQRNLTDMATYLLDKAQELEGNQLLFYLTQKNNAGKTILDLAHKSPLKNMLLTKIQQATQFLIQSSGQKSKNKCKTKNKNGSKAKKEEVYLPKKVSVIFAHIEAGDLKAVKKAMNENKEKYLHETDNDFNNPLHKAVLVGSLEMVKLILTFMCKNKDSHVIIKENIFGRTPRYIAYLQMQKTKDHPDKTEYKKYKTIHEYIEAAIGGIHPENFDPETINFDEDDDNFYYRNKRKNRSLTRLQRGWSCSSKKRKRDA